MTAVVTEHGCDSLTSIRIIMNLIVDSKRDQRVLDWMVSQVGEEAIANACMQLSGARKLYVSNIAKVLDLCPPAELALASRDDAQRHLEAIHMMLGTQQKRGSNDGPT